MTRMRAFRLLPDSRALTAEALSHTHRQGRRISSQSPPQFRAFPPSRAEGDSLDLRIRQAITLTESDLQKDWSLTKLARSVNLTPEHLCRLFKAQTGESPLQYRKRLRLQKAKELLETSCLSVKEIMHAVGIHDVSHFVRDFEKRYGLSPAQYRARYLGARLNCAGPNNQEIKIG